MGVLEEERYVAAGTYRGNLTIKLQEKKGV